MKCDEYREELKSWLESRWDTEEDIKIPESLKKHATECSHCLASLEGARLLVNGTKLRKTTPEGLSQRIITRISQDSVQHRIHWQRWALIPAAAVLIVTFSFLIAHRVFQPTLPETVIVRLELEAPGVSEVMVVGDWNDWDPDVHQLTDDDGDGIWVIELNLMRGEEYQYQFLVDREKWIANPQAPLQVEDGFGGFNSILQI